MAECRTSSQGLVEIERAGIEANREQAGEPTHRAREIDILEDLLAAMSLDINQHRIAPAPTTTPVGNGENQGGQQYIVDATVEGGRHPRQQRPRHRGRQCEREVPRRAGRVPITIERPLDQRSSRRAQHRSPERKLPASSRILRMRRKTLRPMTQRGAPGR